MINYLIEVSIAWAGFYLLYLLFFSKETFFHLNRAYLLSTLLLGLALPLIDISSIVAQVAPSVPTPANYLKTVTITVEAFEQNVEAVVVSSIAESFQVMDILLWIYWFGVAIMLLRFFIGLFQISKLYFTSQHQKKNGYTLILTNNKHLPFSFFNLFFTSNTIPLSTDDQEKITQHELAHIKGKHSIDVLILELTSILLWCSPLVHFYKKSLRNIHEYLADASVLRTTSKKHYGQLLLQMFQTSPGIALANNFIHSQLKKRIKMMTRTQSSKRAYWKYIIALPLVALVALVMTNTQAFAQETNAVSNDDVVIQERIHPVAKQQIQVEKKDDPIFTVVEEMPRFSGCEDMSDKAERKKCAEEKLLNFISKNISYPEEARAKGTQGVVVIRFVINKEGEVTSPEILRGIGEGCEEEALRVIETMPTWIPGKHKGKAVNVYFNMPVRFKLGDSDDVKKEKTIASKEAIGINDEVFKVVEEMPRFPGCEHITDDREEQKNCSQTALINFVIENIEFPKSAQDAGVEGMVVAKFVVNKNGGISNPTLLRKVGHGCDEAVLNAIEQMNAMDQLWIPGKQRGVAVNVEMVLPVKFRLDSAKEKEATTDSKAANDNVLKVDMTIAPNPASGNKVTISYELEDPVSNLRLLATDLNGTVIKTIDELPNDRVNNITLDISKAAKGAIFISLIDGDKIYTQKLMKL